MLKKFKVVKVLSVILMALLLLQVNVTGATTTADYKEYVTYVDSDSARITFESYCSSTYVYVHYKVNNGQDMNYLMSQSGSIWTYDVNGLVGNDVISYWFTYQTGSTQKDTTQWGLSYTHNAVQKVATPTFSPVGGNYSSAQTVTISCTTSGATIRYTTDGSTPTTSSTVYSGAITVSATTTIKAIAIKSGLTTSDVGSATYTITNKVATPTFSPAGGTYTSTQTVAISCATSGATIRYTTDGSTPTASSSAYSTALTVSATTTIKAIGIKAGMTDSDIATATYIINSNPGDYSQSAAYVDSDTGRIAFISNCSSTYVYIHYKVNDGADLNYLMNQSGSTWTYDVNGLNANNHVDYWFTYQISGTQKDTGWFIYNHLQATKVETPTFSPAGGTYNDPQTVNISCGTTGSAIRYTIDGSTPTASSTLYSGAITVSATTTIKAIAIKAGMTNSDIAGATYTIGTNPIRAKFEPSDGKTLLLVGQHIPAVEDYITGTGDVPGGFMNYVDVDNLTGIDKPGMGSYKGSFSDVFNFYFYKDKYQDNYVFQIGMELIGAYEVKVNPDGTITVLKDEREKKIEALLRGDYNAILDRLAKHIKLANVPVFLRVGYEVNGKNLPQNHVAAYRYIYNRLKVVNQCNNIAFVWHVVPGYCRAPYGIADHFQWYPGDEYVDWIAISYFTDVVHGGGISDYDYNNTISNLKMITDYAKAHNKPLMIAESAPMKEFETLLGQASWDGWFAKYFKFIEDNNVKAICYLNEKWSDFAWPEEIWGDTRVEMNSYVKTKWFEKIINSGRYIRKSSNLYGEIGYIPAQLPPPQPLTINTPTSPDYIMTAIKTGVTTVRVTFKLSTVASRVDIHFTTSGGQEGNFEVKPGADGKTYIYDISYTLPGDSVDFMFTYGSKATPHVTYVFM